MRRDRSTSYTRKWPDTSPPFAMTRRATPLAEPRGRPRRFPPPLGGSRVRWPRYRRAVRSMPSDVLRALMYHRILPRSVAGSVNPSLVSADVADFARQAEHLARHYRVVSAEEVFAAS